SADSDTEGETESENESESESESELEKLPGAVKAESPDTQEDTDRDVDNGSSEKTLFDGALLNFLAKGSVDYALPSSSDVSEARHLLSTVHTLNTNVERPWTNREYDTVLQACVRWRKELLGGAVSAQDIRSYFANVSTQIGRPPESVSSMLYQIPALLLHDLKCHFDGMQDDGDSENENDSGIENDSSIANDNGHENDNGNEDEDENKTLNLSLNIDSDIEGSDFDLSL
ncbi:MAG: hypothetical protein MHM6MM_007553, partial [Cercozoa sp. M6MM]